LQWTANNSDGCFSFHHDLTINAQPVENRRQKSARWGAHLCVTGRSTQARKQNIEASPHDAFRQMPYGKGREE
jgi:hypothetical protein